MQGIDDGVDEAVDGRQGLVDGRCHGGVFLVDGRGNVFYGSFFQMPVGRGLFGDGRHGNLLVWLKIRVLWMRLKRNRLLDG
jgi:hypothetical protein